MSIATMKRKTMNANPRLAPISGIGNLGFALNGTRRISGVVGPTNLGPQGNNNIINCNNYNHCNGSACHTNDPTIIKTSVKNTKGMLASRATSCLPHCPPQPAFMPTVQIQSQHISHIHSVHAGCDLSHSQPICVNECKSTFIGGRKIFKGNYTKTPDGTNWSENGKTYNSYAIPQSQYISGKYLKNNCIYPTNINHINRFASTNKRVNNSNCSSSVNC